jgi:hypothetical protein
MITRVGLLRGGNGGVLSVSFADTILEVPAAMLPGEFLTVATLALDPIESLLDAMLSLEGDEEPLCPFL